MRTDQQIDRRGAFAESSTDVLKLYKTEGLDKLRICLEQLSGFVGVGFVDRYLDEDPHFIVFIQAIDDPIADALPSQHYGLTVKPRLIPGGMKHAIRPTNMGNYSFPEAG